ncbi:MAG TPA: hypothetical protein VN761_05660 [Candidatus Polarisedimenticolia bacterium]|nr:hypothetical protein [Candidatus Polarisedimenticolia bacterium]
MSRYITRKEIAAANEVSIDTIARLESRIGLDQCRDQACARPVRYHANPARECLRKNKMNEP